MRFGSVEFFKVLIKTVLAILFFVPLAAAIVFGVLYANQSGELAEAKTSNESLSELNSVLAGEKTGTIEDFCAVFEKSGLSYTEFAKQMNKNKNISAESFYHILSSSGLSDKALAELIAKNKSLSAKEFVDILLSNGMTEQGIVTAIADKNGGAEGWYGILSIIGLSDEEIVKYINEKNGWTSGSPAVETSPYDSIHTDMYVSTPANYTREQGVVYLTFDDGPSDHTYSILQILRRFGIKATFFVVPNRGQYCYTLLKAIAADGHTIGIHSASHEYNKIYASTEAFLDDFYDAWDMVYEATGQKCELFRFPGGSKNDFNEDTREDIIKEMTRRGFRFFDWNVDSNDAMGASWTEMYSSIPNDIRNNYRSVVLMHDSDGTPNTVMVLEDVLQVLVNEGYKFDQLHNDTMPVQFIGPFA